MLEDPESNKYAYYYEKAMIVIITIAFISGLSQAASSSPQQEEVNIVELCFEAIFIVEITARFAACPIRRLFFLRPLNVIDALSGPIFVLRASVYYAIPDDINGFPVSRFLTKIVIGSAPVLRLLKMLRRFQQIHLLAKAFRMAFEALPVMIFMYIVLMISFSALLYITERDENIETFAQAAWLAVVSMTTLGYGDVTPSTTVGNIIVGVFVIASVLYTAVPLGIIGNAFNDVWKDRDHILLMQRTRARFERAGYTSKDIPTLFDLFDADQNGLLDVTEFKWMVSGMKLGLKRDRIMQLYQCFDDDQSGGIDADEFVKALFPEAYAELFEQKMGGVQAARDSVELGSIKWPKSSSVGSAGRGSDSSGDGSHSEEEDSFEVEPRQHQLAMQPTGSEDQFQKYRFRNSVTRASSRISFASSSKSSLGQDAITRMRSSLQLPPS